MNDNTKIILAIVGLFMLSILINQYQNGTYFDKLCQNKYSKDFDSTHYIGSFTKDWKWYCGMQLRSCNLDGTGCFGVGYKELGEMQDKQGEENDKK